MKKYTEKRPWGKFEQFTHNEINTVKILTIKPKEELSLHYHKHRSEFWRILDGKATVFIGKKIIQAKPGDEFKIPTKIQHRVRAKTKIVKILEISFGNFIESDNTRVEDKYNRT